MNIFICIKHVPDTAATVKAGPDNKSIDPTGIEFIVSPYDEIATEEGLRIKEKMGGEVTILSLGPEEAVRSIRHCLAMGADKGVLLKTTDNLWDPISTATAISNYLKEVKPDIILFGKQAVDDDFVQIGPLVAQLLNLPFVNYVTKIELTKDKAICHREVAGGYEVIETTIPAVFTAQKGLNEPRYPSLKGIMSAKKKPFESKEVEKTDTTIEILELSYPPSRPGGRIIGEGPEAVSELIRLLKEEAKII